MKDYGEITITEVRGWGDGAEGGDPGGVVICWSCKIGFGELTFGMRDDDKIQMDAETMSDEFVELVLKALLKQAVRVG